LSRAANSDLEKKVAELADDLKKCQDEKKVAKESFANSQKISKNFRRLTMVI
jgi:hypothetical protein